MTRATLILATMFCLLLSLPVRSQEPSRQLELRARLAQAEFDVRTHELETRMAELAVQEAKIEVERIKRKVEAARRIGNSIEIEQSLEQAEIRVAMRSVQVELMRLQIERAKVELNLVHATLGEKPDKPTPVQVEYVDDMDVVIIRGEAAAVDRIKALIERAARERAENE